jgi:peroxiredoxin
MDLHRVPDGLPVPIDGGGCDHLPGLTIPPVALRATSGQDILFDQISRGEAVVIYCYPMTGRPSVSLPDGWDAIPGARGCTPQACGFRDYHADLTRLGIHLFGLSTQATDYQREAVERLYLTFDLLSDEGLTFTHALRLPTFVVKGCVLVKRLTLIFANGIIEKVFYPVFPPDRNASDVLDWLTRRENQ